MSDDISFSTSSSITSAAAASFDDVPYYMWFLKAVAKWLDIALFKAVRRILKAVELVRLDAPSSFSFFNFQFSNTFTVISLQNLFKCDICFPKLFYTENHLVII